MNWNLNHLNANSNFLFTPTTQCIIGNINMPYGKTRNNQLWHINRKGKSLCSRKKQLCELSNSLPMYASTCVSCAKRYNALQQPNQSLNNIHYYDNGPTPMEVDYICTICRDYHQNEHRDLCNVCYRKSQKKVQMSMNRLPLWSASRSSTQQTSTFPGWGNYTF